jgi:hypothetical protein
MAITQPRRISAVAVAERIASERCEPVGTTIGYNIRLYSAKSASTQMMFMTPGVLCGLLPLRLRPTLPARSCWSSSERVRLQLLPLVAATAQLLLVVDFGC